MENKWNDDCEWKSDIIWKNLSWRH